MNTRTEIWRRWMAIMILSLVLLLAGIVEGNVSPSDAERNVRSINQQVEVSL